MDRTRIARLIDFENEGGDSSTGFNSVSDILVRTYTFKVAKSYIDFVFETLAANCDDCYDSETGELYKEPYVDVWTSGGWNNKTNTTYEYEVRWVTQEGSGEFFNHGFVIRFRVHDVDNNDWKEVFRNIKNKIKSVKGPLASQHEKDNEGPLADVLEYILDNTTQSGDTVVVAIDTHEIKI